MTFGTENDHVTGNESTADVVRGGRPVAEMDDGDTTVIKDASNSSPEMYQMNSVSHQNHMENVTSLYSHFDDNGSSPWIGPPPETQQAPYGLDAGVNRDPAGYPYYDYETQGYQPFYPATSVAGVQEGMQVGTVIGDGFAYTNAQSSPEQQAQRIRGPGSGSGSGSLSSTGMSPGVQPTRIQGGVQPSRSMTYSHYSQGSHSSANASATGRAGAGNGVSPLPPVPLFTEEWQQDGDLAHLSRKASSATSTAIAPVYGASGLRRTGSGSSINRHDAMAMNQVASRSEQAPTVGQAIGGDEEPDDSAYGGMTTPVDQRPEVPYANIPTDPNNATKWGEQGTECGQGQSQVRHRTKQSQGSSTTHWHSRPALPQDGESLHEGTIDAAFTDQKHDFRVTNNL